MKHIISVVLVGLLFPALISISAMSCVPSDWEYNLNIGSLDIDIDEAINGCQPETCIISENFIAVRSHYNEKSLLIIWKTPSIFDRPGISIRLPYQADADGVPIASEINPKEYNLKASARIDLLFLKDLRVLKNTSEEISIISDLANSGKNVLDCKNEWRAYEASAGCDMEGKDVFLNCGGAVPVKVSFPEKPIVLTKTVNQDQKERYSLDFLIVPATIGLGILVGAILVYKKKKSDSK